MKKWAKRSVLFGIDGAGTYFEQADTPNIDRIFKNGAVSRRTLTEIPTISAECWGSMLHGVDCRCHGLTNWATGRRPFPADSPYPSVFRVIREHRPEAEMASFCDWNNVNTGIIEENIGVYKYHAPDSELVQPAIDYINTHDFTMIYFQFDSVDHAGHSHGYGSPELEAWYAEKEEPFPFSSGANKAYRAWKYSPTDEVIMEDYCWDTERHDFIETLRKAGVKTFVTVNKSTGLMEDLHGYPSPAKRWGISTLLKGRRNGRKECCLCPLQTFSKP